MKQILLTFVFFLYLFMETGFSQSSNDTAIQRQSYLFDEFIMGTVVSKSGEVNRAPLNYCAFDQTIIFREGGKTFTLIGLTEIDTVYIETRKFVPVNKTVYEVINNSGKVALCASYGSKIQPQVATADHTGTSKQNVNSVSNTVSNVYVNRPYKGNFSISIKKNYWLKDFNNLHKANNLKDFLNVFKEYSNATISEYVTRNPIDFRKEADLIKLVNFCNSL